MAETTKADLEKEIHGLKVKLGRAESKVSELEAELATSAASTPVDADRVFGPDAVPLEQR
jgi:phage shock protein A